MEAVLARILNKSPYDSPFFSLEISDCARGSLPARKGEVGDGHATCLRLHPQRRRLCSHVFLGNDILDRIDHDSIGAGPFLALPHDALAMNNDAERNRRYPNSVVALGIGEHHCRPVIRPLGLKLDDRLVERLPVDRDGASHHCAGPAAAYPSEAHEPHGDPRDCRHVRLSQPQAIVATHQKSPVVSPRLDVLRFFQVIGSMASLTNRTAPSHMAVITPPPCLLREVTVI